MDIKPASIFNDVIGPVMRGPSSSHCAAALRIDRIARDLMDGKISKVTVSFDRKGSLPTTHTSQGSDMGLIFRKWIPWFVSLAFLIGLSRIAVTAHRPSDVLFGAYIGIFTALWTSRFLNIEH